MSISKEKTGFLVETLHSRFEDVIGFRCIQFLMFTTS